MHRVKNSFLKRGGTIGGLFLIWILLSVTVAPTGHLDGIFELDGNATDDSPSGPPDDWDHRADAISSDFIADGADPPADTTYFTGGGSKDTNDLDQWSHTDKDQAPDKDELTNAYAAAYAVEGELMLYFGADRYASNGDAQIGFWFFRDAISLNPDGTFKGRHQVGDVLVLSDFVKGGKILDIKAYRWVGSGGSDGPLDLIAQGVDCDDLPAGDTNTLCATVNEQRVDAPWPYTPKSGAPGRFPGGPFTRAG